MNEIENPISAINEQYFGKDSRRNYLRDDFLKVLKDIIQREVMIYTFIECSKTYRNKLVDKNNKGEVVSTRYGIFDPDNSNFLYSIMDTHEKGFMVNLRQLLTPCESGAGGKFVKELRELTVNDFLNHYKNAKSDKIIIPPVLFKYLLQNRGSEHRVKLDNILIDHFSEIEIIFNELINRANKFVSVNYHEKIIKQYQALAFHKDREPEKYDITETVRNFGLLTTRKVTKRNKAKIETSLISKAMEDFSTIIFLYQSLIGDNTNFIASNFPLDNYIERTLDLFIKKVLPDTKQNIVDDLVKNLPLSLNLVGWRIKSI